MSHHFDVFAFSFQIHSLNHNLGRNIMVWLQSTKGDWPVDSGAREKTSGIDDDTTIGPGMFWWPNRLIWKMWLQRIFFSRYVLVSDLTSILWHICSPLISRDFPAIFWSKEFPTAKFAPVESLRSWVCHCWCCWTFIVPTGCMPLGEPRWTENLKKKDTIPETGSSHLKMDGWNTSFLLGWPILCASC